MADIRVQEVQGPAGRTLRVRDAGPVDGFPVFVHHGTPMAGLLFQPSIEDAARRGLRLVSHDRPGYGGSDRHEGRLVADVAADVAAIADHLGMERFATWGISGGGPHSLACAALLPERVTAAAVLAGICPPDAEGLDLLAGMGEDNVLEFTTARDRPEDLIPLLEDWRAEMLAAEPEELFDSVSSLISDADRAVLTGELAAYFHECEQVGLARGIHGWYDDDRAFVRAWGFDLADIRVPVLIWQGAQDRMVPYAHGEWLAAHVPGCEARLLEDEGHLTLMVTRVADTHAWLAERSAA